MPINQLNDDGAVIGYKPNLQYKKDKTFSSEINSDTNIDYSDDTIYTDTLLGFEENSPSKTLSDIDYVTNNLRKLVDKLASAFKKGNWNQYNDISTLLSAVDSNNKKYIQDFVNYHHGSLNGSIIPELIQDIHDTKEKMDVISKIIKELYYGDENIPLEDAESIDKDYISKMKSYEKTDENEKINYLSLTYDGILNRSISMYSFNVNSKAISISDIVFKQDDSNVDVSKVSVIKKLFDDINTEIDYRRSNYNLEQSVEIIQKTLYNYYDKRKFLIDLYDITGSSESIYLKRKIVEYQNIVDDAIKNVNRALTGTQFYLEEKTKLEQEKHYLLNIYAQLNYNS